MQFELTQNFVSALKVNPIFSAEPVVSLLISVGPAPNAKKLLFQLSAWYDELLSTPKIKRFLSK